MRVRSFDYLKKQILGHKIIKREWNTIVLDNGAVLSIEETELYGNAWTYVEFHCDVPNVEITGMSDIRYESWKNGNAYGCKASVNFLHNNKVICTAFAETNSSFDGRYYSVVSFIMHPVGEEKYLIDFVAADDGE